MSYFFKEQPEEETAETMNFRLPPHPSRNFQTACHKTSALCSLSFLCEFLILPLFTLFSLHMISSYSYRAKVHDISLTKHYEDYIALWSFSISSVTSSISFAALTAMSPLLWRVPILSGCRFEEGQWARRNSQLRKTLADSYVCSKPHSSCEVPTGVAVQGSRTGHQS